ncbi:MAG: aminopeptidase P family protein, partial [Aquificae bacterium]|nr:aminopeptidase P family protein [Aquificota bacterium]
MKIKQVQEKIKKEGLDAFLFSSTVSVFYLSRFRSTHAYAVLTPSEKFLLTDARYYERAKRELRDWEVILIKSNPVRTLKNFLKERSFKLVGYEEERVNCTLRRKLRSRDIKWVGYANFLKEERAYKTKEEINLIKEGVR